jgi:predicted secreted Zn-dependent protease
MDNEGSVRIALPFLLATLVLPAAATTAAGRTEPAGANTKPSVRVTNATGPVTRLTTSRITVSKLSCTRLRTGPSLRGVGLGTRVTISCKNGALTKVTPLRPAKPATQAAPAVVTTPPTTTPAASTAPVPAPGTCTRDTSYQSPAPLGLSVTQTGVIEQIDPPHLYNVSGDTVAEINTQIRQCRPSAASPYAAVTRYALGYRYTSTRQAGGTCRLTGVAVGLHVGVVLPSWTPGLNPAGGLADQWATYIAALALHEQGHVDRYRAAARNLVDQLAALTDLECASVSSTVSATVLSFNVGVSREQDAYDAETGHGRTQGATLIST